MVVERNVLHEINCIITIIYVIHCTCANINPNAITTTTVGWSDAPLAQRGCKLCTLKFKFRQVCVKAL